VPAGHSRLSLLQRRTRASQGIFSPNKSRVPLQTWSAPWERVGRGEEFGGETMCARFCRLETWLAVGVTWGLGVGGGMAECLIQKDPDHDEMYTHPAPPRPECPYGKKVWLAHETFRGFCAFPEVHSCIPCLVSAVVDVACAVTLPATHHFTAIIYHRCLLLDSSPATAVLVLPIPPSLPGLFANPSHRKAQSLHEVQQHGTHHAEVALRRGREALRRRSHPSPRWDIALHLVGADDEHPTKANGRACGATASEAVLPPVVGHQRCAPSTWRCGHTTTGCKRTLPSSCTEP